MKFTVKELAKKILGGATLRNENSRCSIEECKRIPVYQCELYEDWGVDDRYESETILLCSDCFNSVQSIVRYLDRTLDKADI